MKTLCILFFVIIAMLFSSSGNTNSEKQIIAKDGIEYFELYEGDIEINYNLIPGNELLFQGDCTYIDYYYRAYYDNWSFFYDCEKTMVTIVYEDDVYTVAKETYLNNLQTDGNTLQYNGYEFKINSGVGMGRFPESFGVVGFNDELNTIVFLGFDSNDKSLEEIEVKDNWGEFLEVNFIEAYDFEEHIGRDNR